MQCPKCHAPMHTYNRNGVQIEQCSGCRGIFLDYGELEALTRVESQWSQPAPPPQGAPQAYPSAPAPAWGAPQHGGHGGGHYGGHGGHHRHKSFGHMLFSS
ncbi:zf-TFIIB domain-containing protein [Streptomyces sp. NPDC060011]|uniref:Zf-TFIIB domain-containing protein n=1 Tax=Streptomyces sp. R21 TaxID=3238627 RepID=A0AB39PHF1_9ACTN|nr:MULTISPECIES: zf-TFIIB domain-containing protein [unclassified Streptomyces]MCX4913570.1 zf-TFIIB domain-containing protein [Streptomyces sp. NBC_00687]MCX5137976.1 zf-TFIIB domain-containing protein [Streptomyces sp. NBC_00340]MCX5282155.1 zf-TFIIB domain-containing protein [Streptomyces sp. NBC_00198]NEB28592.1 zf-TFIIB domain-containing protein [Streptomyces sp. SID14446]OQQ15021.1 zf-TFIIB domain containing protein [Streptomyces sp. M41(2017)]